MCVRKLNKRNFIFIIYKTTTINLKKKIYHQDTRGDCVLKTNHQTECNSINVCNYLKQKLNESIVLLTNEYNTLFSQAE